jgi:hypothetical protein
VDGAGHSGALTRRARSDFGRRKERERCARALSAGHWRRRPRGGGHRHVPSLAALRRRPISRDDYRKYCADQLVKELNVGPLHDKPLTSEESAALRRLARGMTTVSVDAVFSDGKWYLETLRSYVDGINALPEPLDDNDLILLLHRLKR